VDFAASYCDADLRHGDHCVRPRRGSVRHLARVATRGTTAFREPYAPMRFRGRLPRKRVQSSIYEIGSFS
jgi:hypothetical protein